MAKAPPVHRAPITHNARHCRPEADRQARRTLATNSAAWRRIRGAQLAREPLCRMCKAKGIQRAANVVDHIDGDATNNDVANLQSLDKKCHDRKTVLEDGGFGRWSMQPAWLPVSTRPLIVVCGPPGSGKSTYVDKHRKPGDLLLDLDSIAAEYGYGAGHRTSGQLGVIVKDRNSRLAAYIEGRTRHTRCYVVTTAGTPQARDYWRSKGATVVVIDPGAVECAWQIQHDVTRSPALKRRQLAEVGRWR